MQKVIGDQRTDNDFADRFSRLRSELFADCSAAQQWNAVLCDDLEPHAWSLDKPTKLLKFNRRWVASYEREKRMHLVDAYIVIAIMDVSIVADETGEDERFEWCRVMKYAAEKAEVLGEEALAAQLRFLLKGKLEELEWVAPIEPDVDKGLEVGGWMVILHQLRLWSRKN
jgi:hypothetical protein